jgi:hemerythrin
LTSAHVEVCWVHDRALLKVRPLTRFFSVISPLIKKEAAMQSALTSDCTSPATGVLVMDMLHRQVDDALHAALTSDDRAFLPRFHALVAILESAFATEESWMAEVDYPATMSHREQHARVLGGMHHVHCSLLAGDVDIARRVVACLLPDWLKLHAATLDTALAVYLEVSGMPELGPPLFAGQILDSTELGQ